MPPREIVLDTNIWVSYILKGQLEKLALLVIENDLTVYSSERLIAELEEVLARPEISQHLSLPLEDYVNFHRNLAEVSRVNYAFRGSPDPKDDFLFDLALSADATHLVTNDKLLLGLGQVRNVKVISLLELMKLLDKK
jgi:hypothetical protein